MQWVEYVKQCAPNFVKHGVKSADSNSLILLAIGIRQEYRQNFRQMIYNCPSILIFVFVSLNPSKMYNCPRITIFVPVNQNF